MIDITFKGPKGEEKVVFHDSEAGYLATIAMALDWLKDRAQGCHDFDREVRDDGYKPDDKWKWFDRCAWIWDKAAMPRHYTPSKPKISRPAVRRSPGLMPRVEPEASSGGLMGPISDEDPVWDEELEPFPDEVSEEEMSTSPPKSSLPSAVPDKEDLRKVISEKLYVGINGPPDKHKAAMEDLADVCTMLDEGINKASKGLLKVRRREVCTEDGEQGSIFFIHCNMPSDFSRYHAPVGIISFVLRANGYPINIHGVINVGHNELDIRIGEKTSVADNRDALYQLILELSTETIPTQACFMLRRMDKARAKTIQEFSDAVEALKKEPEEKDPFKKKHPRST